MCYARFWLIDMLIFFYVLFLVSWLFARVFIVCFRWPCSCSLLVLVLLGFIVMFRLLCAMCFDVGVFVLLWFAFVCFISLFSWLVMLLFICDCSCLSLFVCENVRVILRMQFACCLFWMCFGCCCGVVLLFC